ncbi:MAG TPA: hypothetical protein QGI59_04470 [Candidatus Poseidoniia archaeon]|jgi:hypothetical protein|nr:hypothetical protein [Candidatus Poseidoniia archaeon]
MLNIKNDLLLVVVPFIILGLVIPDGGLLRDYTTEYCNHFPTEEIVDPGTGYVEFYLNKEVGFFSCEIGYIEGYAKLTYIVSFLSSFEKDIFILDYSNYNAYLNGDVFGINNLDLTVTHKATNETNFFSAIETTFLPGNYFLVINWDYRTIYGSENVERPYFLDHTDSNGDYPATIFSYYLDVDYINPITGYQR